MSKYHYFVAVYSKLLDNSRLVVDRKNLLLPGSSSENSKYIELLSLEEFQSLHNIADVKAGVIQDNLIFLLRFFLVDNTLLTLEKKLRLFSKSDFARYLKSIRKNVESVFIQLNDKIKALKNRPEVLELQDVDFAGAASNFVEVESCKEVAKVPELQDSSPNVSTSSPGNIVSIRHAQLFTGFLLNWFWCLSPETKQYSVYSIGEFIAKGAQGVVAKFVNATNTQEELLVKIVEEPDKLREETLEIIARSNTVHYIFSAVEATRLYFVMPNLGKTLSEHFLGKNHQNVSQGEKFLTTIDLIHKYRKFHLDFDAVFMDLSLSNAVIKHNLDPDTGNIIGIEVNLIDYGCAAYYRGDYLAPITSPVGCSINMPYVISKIANYEEFNKKVEEFKKTNLSDGVIGTSPSMPAFMPVNHNATKSTVAKALVSSGDNLQFLHLPNAVAYDIWALLRMICNKYNYSLFPCPERKCTLGNTFIRLFSDITAGDVTPDLLHQFTIGFIEAYEARLIKYYFCTYDDSDIIDICLRSRSSSESSGVCEEKASSEDHSKNMVQFPVRIYLDLYDKILQNHNIGKEDLSWLKSNLDNFNDVCHSWIIASVILYAQDTDITATFAIDTILSMYGKMCYNRDKLMREDAAHDNLHKSQMNRHSHFCNLALFADRTWDKKFTSKLQSYYAMTSCCPTGFVATS